MMMFKTWGYITMAQALTFTSDFKLGHYMKIPPMSGQGGFSLLIIHLACQERIRAVLYSVRQYVRRCKFIDPAPGWT